MSKTPDARARMIFNTWKASLANKDRTLTGVRSNFDELWHDIYVANIDFDTAYSFLDEAIAAHAPNKSVVKQTYKRIKHTLFDKDEKDFLDSWMSKIRAEATESFHDLYPLEAQFEEKRAAPAPTINGIPRQEYNKQRKYVEQFPLLTVKEIERRFAEIQKEYSDDEVLKIEELLDGKAE